MGYILKNTSGLINTRLTDTGRQKLSEGRFNISYFQVGDSEVSYNTLPSTYNQMDTNILEPEFNAQNSTGVPESNKHQVKYPYYVDAGSKNTFGVPFMASVPTSIFNRAAMRGFFSGNTTAETISWSALTNDQYAINANYVVDMSAITCTDTIDLILSSCYTDPVREPQAGDFVTIYYDGNGLTDCSCVYPPPTPTCQTDCWTTGFTLNIQFDSGPETPIAVLPMVNSGSTLVNGKPYYYSYPYPASVYWNGSSWILDITTTTEKNLGSSPIGSFTGVTIEEDPISGYTECGESEYICLEYCQENQECFQTLMIKANVGGQTFYFSIEGDYLIGFDNDEFILLSGDTQVGVLTGLTENVYPVGSFSAASPFTALTTTLGYCPSSSNFYCGCVSMTADSGNDLVRYYDCNGFLNNEPVESGNTFSACTLFNAFNALSGGTTDLCEVDCSTPPLGNYSPQIYGGGEPCITPSPTPTPSATCCPVPSPTPACPLPEPHASCVMDMDSCHMVLTYRITRVCGNTIYLDRNTPDFSNYSNCYARLIIYPSSINEIYDSYTPRPHWNDNVIDFESVCGVDAFDVKIWNMNIPWSENPAGLDPTISSDYTTFASRTYLGSKEYFGYASSSGQTFYNPVTSATTTTDTFYYNSLGDIIDVQPKEQKAIAIIHYTNNAIDLFYGEKFALQPYDPQNPQDTTGQARNFKLHLPWVMWHKNPTCCNGETFYVDPEGFDELDLFQVHYILSKKNTNMNNPGIRYYHLWDTHPNPDGYPSRVGKVFPDHKLIVIDDEELIAVMSYKSNRNWTLPAPRLSLITPNTCGNDSNSTTGILSGNGQTLYVTYKLSDPQTCIENLHCNYYPYLTGPNLNCNNIQPQNVAVRFGSEFNCLDRAGIDCWQNEFTITQYFESFINITRVYKFKNTYTYLNGKPIYSENIFGSNVYWDGQNWVIDNSSLTSPIVIGSTILGTFVDSSQDPPIYFTSSCDPSTYICLTACNETECNSSSLFYQNISDLIIVWTPSGDGNTIEWSADTQEFVALSGSTPIGILTGLTENDFPIGTFTPIAPFTSVTSTAGTCELTCSCIEFTAGTCGYDLKYNDCDGILNTETLSGSQVFSACVLNNLYNDDESLTTGSCVSECYTTTTTTCPPLGCLINEGYYSTKFEIVCQLVTGGGRPESDLWKIIDFTPQISGTTINGYLTQSGLTGSTFVITLDDYNNAPFYDLNDYISLPSVGSTGYSLNFGDEYYFYGNLETDIQATIYEMKYKVNLSQTEFQISSNPTWTLGTSSYITEIGLYDNEKDLMIVSKLQSPVLRQNVQQFLIKFDF